MINFTIILADDEQQILYGMKNGIDWESLGFSVVGTAQNGKEALELIEEYHPDLLISDIKMPFMDGLELSKTIHENYINTKIILFSGWDDFEYARTAISYGVSQYIMKPIDYNEMQKLLTTMHEELEKEYAEKMNRTRLENIYTESIPLLRQQFFTQLLTETLTEDYCTLQMKNLKLNLDYEVFHIITVKIRENDLNDVLSELSIKETIKESLEKITDLYHFGMIDREVFFLCGNKKHDIERITRTIQEASVIIERIFHTKISCGISSSGTSLRALPVLYQQALEALDYNHAIGILLIYPENYLTQQENHYDYNNVLAITATMQTAFSHYAAFENSPSPSYLLPVSAQVIKKIQDGKTDCIYIKNTYKLGYESIQMLDTYSRNKYMKDISIPCHKVDKAAIESGELDALLTN